MCAREKKIKIERESESVYVRETEHQSIYIYQKKTIKETSGCQKRPLYVKETSKCGQKRHMYVKREDAEGKYEERWGAGVETQKNVRGEIGGWGRVPFN